MTTKYVVRFYYHGNMKDFDFEDIDVEADSPEEAACLARENLGLMMFYSDPLVKIDGQDDDCFLKL